jgi:hypothetical protein
MHIAAAQQAYQAQLEHVRACESHPEVDDQLVVELREDLDRAWAAVQVAWCEHAYGRQC